MLQTSARATEPEILDGPPLPGLMVALFANLRRRGVRYCHWKSNLRLEQGLRGETDLDLLVDPAHREDFAEALREHDVRAVRAAPGREYPAIENYLAFDEASGRLFHLHVHYRLVLGEQFVKNYSLPLEQAFLDSARLVHGVYVPAPELELIVLSLRALLKYRDRDVVKDVLNIRYPGVPANITDEIHWLLAQTSLDQVAARLGELGERVPGETVLAFLRTITTAPRDGRTLFRLRGRARRALATYQRGSRARAALVYFRELWRRRNRLRLSPARGMTLPQGGRALALVGADGAGKSTMCRELRNWLRWKLDAKVYYLGSKEPSRRSRALYMLFRMARRGHTELSARLGEASPLCLAIATARRALLYSHCLSIGLDRYARYRAGGRLARAGSVVIFDRYPLEALSERMDLRLLDGPQIPLLARDDEGVLARAMGAAERWLYRRMGPPRHLFVLDVSPDVSLRRKPDHRREAVLAKSEALRGLAEAVGQRAGQVELVRLSADEPFDEVLARLKAHVWRVMR